MVTCTTPPFRAAVRLNSGVRPLKAFRTFGEFMNAQAPRPNNKMIGAGIAIGAGIGAGLGVVFHNIPIGVGLGVAIGMLFGLALSKRAR